jgi:HAD superfamily hydrolase (TIGR01509 family)
LLKKPLFAQNEFMMQTAPQPGALMQIDLVIFDCDGVLIDSELISAKMLISELANHGVDIDLTYVARHFLGRSYPMVLSQVRREFKITLPDHFEDDYRARLLAAFENDLKIMPGVFDVIASLDRPKALATSSSPSRVKQSLALTGLNEVFSGHIYTSTMVAQGKPAPDLFLHVAADMRVDPSNVLVIEDSLNGLRAALAAGMQVCRFTGGSHLQGIIDAEPPDATPHTRIDHWNAFYATYPDLKRG